MSNRDSILTTGTAGSYAGSTRRLLPADIGSRNMPVSNSPPSGSQTLYPSPTIRPFASPSSSSSREGSVNKLKPPAADSNSNLSLTVNYIPSKFSGALLTGSNARRRKGKNSLDGLPKRGGGVDAFRSGQNRIPGVNDEDEDDGPDDGKRFLRPKTLRWNRFKWTLFVANLILTIYSLTALIFCLLTWFNVWVHADIVRAGNHAELVLSTLAAVTGLITSLLGWAGILLNNRAFLAVYCLMTWITFAFLVIPGYVTYRRRAFNLEGKLNAQWSRDLGTEGRLRIQNQLQCCGYFSPFVEATISSTCYARSILPGCKKHYLDFQRLVLGRWYKVAFGLVPLQLFVMVAGLLCSNHITYRFGKGMMPKRYRLKMDDMAVIMETYANQLAEQYGSDVAADMLKRSRSNLQLERNKSDGSSSTMANMPTMPYTPESAALQERERQQQHMKYDSVTKAPTPEAF